jgi:hypothetical protein
MAAAASGRRRSWRGADEHGGTRRTRAPGKCGDAFPQLNLDRSRPERGDRQRGGARVLTGGNGGRRYVNPIDKTTLHIYPMCSFTYIYDLNTSF